MLAISSDPIVPSGFGIVKGFGKRRPHKCPEPRHIGNGREQSSDGRAIAGFDHRFENENVPRSLHSRTWYFVSLAAVLTGHQSFYEIRCDSFGTEPLKHMNTWGQGAGPHGTAAQSQQLSRGSANVETEVAPPGVKGRDLGHCPRDLRPRGTKLLGDVYAPYSIAVVSVNSAFESRFELWISLGRICPNTVRQVQSRRSRSDWPAFRHKRTFRSQRNHERATAAPAMATNAAAHTTPALNTKAATSPQPCRWGRSWVCGVRCIFVKRDRTSA